ncbi:helix-turn-helix domain-containing protein [Desulfofundulus salinus]|uniref:Uncharacterized protein n=1 Tax=Desulfofundulus salinus TaxID=2419843 RepID=A0A494X1G3_9FIRM|nr:helix-turn-helix domain-containing protein [Desulfofundulus salinum]RKO67037.1 hypothetical protein D7024_08785 [Desulfofundulus salinum]
MRERETKMAMARNFRKAGMALREIADRLDVSRETVRLWLSDTDRAFHEDIREKAKARPRQAIGKKKPRQLITPSCFRGVTPWWTIAPPVVLVDIPTGQVLVYRWPLE